MGVGRSYCLWTGVRCAPTSVSVESLTLSGRGLSGTLPAELGSLISLRTLDLSGNNLSGPLPPTIGRQPNLSAVNLARNRLSGTVPVALRQLVAERAASSSAAAATARAVAGAAQLSVSLGGNDLRDCGPYDDPGECAGLLDLAAAWGLFSGRWAGLGGTPFCGQVGGAAPWPGLACNALRARVVTLDVAGWGLRGTIPASLGTAFPLLHRAALDRNQFTGAFPDELKALSGSKLVTVAASVQLSSALGASEAERVTIADTVSVELGTDLLDVYPQDSSADNPLSAAAASSSAIARLPPGGSGVRRLAQAPAADAGQVLIVFTVCPPPGDGGCGPSLPQQLARGLQQAAETLAAAAAAASGGPPSPQQPPSSSNSSAPAPPPSPPPQQQQQLASVLAVSVSLSVPRVVVADGNRVTDCRVTDDISDCAHLLQIHAAWGEGLWPAVGSSSFCTWEGVECDPDSRVVGIALPARRPAPLRGTIPEALGRLQLLRRVDLSGNELTGTLPTSLKTRAAVLGRAFVDGITTATAGNVSGTAALAATPAAWRLGGNRLRDCGPLDDAADCAALLDISADWSVWTADGGSSFCAWEGVACDDGENFRVSGISLPGPRNPPIAAALPEALGSLRFLRSLNVSGNALHGTIPRSLRALAGGGDGTGGGGGGGLLTEASAALWGNRIRDCGLLDDAAECAALVAANETWGGLWAEQGGSPLCSWPHISCVSASNATAAAAVGNSSSDAARRVRRLEVSSGDPRFFSGRNIPPEIGSLRWLEVLDLRLANLSGAIPPSLANLTAASVILLGNNSLVGTIPPGLRALIRSRLSSSPTATGKPPPLITYSFFGNQLSDCGPLDTTNPPADCAALLGVAADWALFGPGAPWAGRGGTAVCGDAMTPQPWPGLTCASSAAGVGDGASPQQQFVEAFELRGKGIRGTISAHLGDLSHVTRFDFADNQLRGTVPSDLGRCPALRTVVRWRRATRGCCAHLITLLLFSILARLACAHQHVH